MVYQGSKAKLRKYILPILQKCIDENHIDFYIEPFVGGANMIDHIRCKNRIGSDNNTELIALLQYMQRDEKLSIFPKDCSLEHYKDVRENRKNNGNKYSLEYTAGIGYFASFGGKYFDGGYGRSKNDRCIYKKRLENAKKQASSLKRIEFSAKDYLTYAEYENCCFYLDPPYRNTEKYCNKKFDFIRFDNFARELSKNNFVFISEFSMPDDFECILEIPRNINQNANRSKAIKKYEKLFVHRSSLWKI